MAIAAHRARDRVPATAGAYLKAAGIGVRRQVRGDGDRRQNRPTKMGDHRVGRGKTGQHGQPNPNPYKTFPRREKQKQEPQNLYQKDVVTTGFGVELSDSEQESLQSAPSTSLCEPFREAIELGLSQGRNAMGIWQDMVCQSGFNGGYQTVKRFVRKLRGNQPPQPRAVIITAPGQESQVDYGTEPMPRDLQPGEGSD